MSKKKDKQQKEIGAANMLRFYDTDLIERLNKRFNESGNRYEHKNHFLTDLIEAGLNRREQEISFKDKLLANETSMYKSVDALAEWLMEFAKYVRAQFQAMGASNYLIKAMLASTYNITEAGYLRKIILPDSIKKGVCDALPERFVRLEETAKETFMRNE